MGKWTHAARNLVVELKTVATVDEGLFNIVRSVWLNPFVTPGDSANSMRTTEAPPRTRSECVFARRPGGA